jgi:type IV pilus assembly protein PilY1
LRIHNGVQYVYVGTGQLLGEGDLTTTQLQSVYGIRDPLNSSNPVYPNLRGVLKPLKTDTALNVVCAAASCSDEPAGWVIDLSVSGERVNIRPGLLGDWLVVATNRPLPNPQSCSSTMESKLYFIDPLAGESAQPGRAFAGAAVGLTYVYPSTGLGPRGDREAIWLRFADGRREMIEPPPPPGLPKVFKRASWRRIFPVAP